VNAHHTFKPDKRSPNIVDRSRVSLLAKYLTISLSGA